MENENVPTPNIGVLWGDVRKLIEDARERTAVAVNRELTLLHWNIGNRIRKDILGEERALWGTGFADAVYKIDGGIRAGL